MYFLKLNTTVNGSFWIPLVGLRSFALSLSASAISRVGGTHHKEGQATSNGGRVIELLGKNSVDSSRALMLFKRRKAWA